MGGANSGRPKPRERTLIEDCDCLDIKDIIEFGFIVYPALAFIEGEPDPKFVSIHAYFDSIGKIFSTNQKIRLTVAYPHLGGKEFWIICPKCNQSVRKLYRPSDSNHFRCRICHDLMCQSQVSNVYDGWVRKTAVIASVSPKQLTEVNCLLFV